MRHSRKAVMAEHYKLYLKKHVFNGRYFVRNLQIGVGIGVTLALGITGTVLLTQTDNEAKAATSTVATVKEVLFGSSETEKPATISKEEQEPTTAEVTVSITEAVVAQSEVQTESTETTTQETVESEFDGKCIANVDETLNIRTEPSAEAEFAGYLNKGAIARISGTEGEWTKIKSGEVEGYVRTDYILTGEQAEEFAKDYVTLCGTVLESGVNVRAEKSTDSEIVTVLEKDDTITVLEDLETLDEQNTTEEVLSQETAVQEMEIEAVAEESSEEAAVQEEQSTEQIVNETIESDIQWVSVMLEDGRTGYVSSDYLDIERLYEIAVSVEEIERKAAEEAAAKQAAEEAARQAAEAAAATVVTQTPSVTTTESNNTVSTTTSNNSNANSYSGATTTPVTATTSGESLGTFVITAYCGCSSCSGGHNKTATGTTPTEGRTIAADPSVLPYGTKVVIGGVVYTVEDCGSGVGGNHIDIFFASHSAAMSFGRKTMEVFRY